MNGTILSPLWPHKILLVAPGIKLLTQRRKGAKPGLCSGEKTQFCGTMPSTTTPERFGIVGGGWAGLGWTRNEYEKMTAETIRAMKGGKIAALTAYDFPMTRLVDETGVPLILVGDLAGDGGAGLRGHDVGDAGGNRASRARGGAGEAEGVAGGGSACLTLTGRRRRR